MSTKKIHHRLGKRSPYSSRMLICLSIMMQCTSIILGVRKQGPVRNFQKVMAPTGASNLVEPGTKFPITAHLEDGKIGPLNGVDQVSSTNRTETTETPFNNGTTGMKNV